MLNALEIYDVLPKTCNRVSHLLYGMPSPDNGKREDIQLYDTLLEI